jgi:hypothetical protein
MLARLAADLVVLLHLAFILFVIVGALAVLRWPRLAWLHVPAVLWGAWIELAGWICPLTPLENRLRRAGGEAGYGADFIDHYLLPVIYPQGLSRGLQVLLGAGALALNVILYTVVWRRARRRAT